MFHCVHPCPCGYHGDSQKPCTYAPAVVAKYQKRISGPLLDRIDIHIEVLRVDYGRGFAVPPEDYDRLKLSMQLIFKQKTSD